MKIVTPVSLVCIDCFHGIEFRVWGVSVAITTLRRYRWDAVKTQAILDRFMRHQCHILHQTNRRRTKELEMESAKMADSIGIPQHAMRIYLGLDRLD